MTIMPHMIDEYQQKRVEFRKILLGILSERNRWSQCVEWTNKKLGMAVGALFIRDNFNHESKVAVLALRKEQSADRGAYYTVDILFVGIHQNSMQTFSPYLKENNASP
jgi:hypothetical protein